MPGPVVNCRTVPGRARRGPAGGRRARGRQGSRGRSLGSLAADGAGTVRAGPGNAGRRTGAANRQGRGKRAWGKGGRKGGAQTNWGGRAARGRAGGRGVNKVHANSSRGLCIWFGSPTVSRPGWALRRLIARAWPRPCAPSERRRPRSRPGKLNCVWLERGGGAAKNGGVLTNMTVNGPQMRGQGRRLKKIVGGKKKGVGWVAALLCEGGQGGRGPRPAGRRPRAGRPRQRRLYQIIHAAGCLEVMHARGPLLRVVTHGKWVDKAPGPGWIYAVRARAGTLGLDTVQLSPGPGPAAPPHGERRARGAVDHRPAS
jgi:hypothetical protein